MARFRPLQDRIPVRRIEAEERTPGGIIIPDTVKEKPVEGEVLAVGPGRIVKGERVQFDIEVGDTVIYGKYTGMPYQVGDDELIIIKASEVLAKIV